MAITDSEGNKISQPKTSKRIFAKNVRQKRMLALNPHYCLMCGFRVRGENHLEGTHHQQAEGGNDGN